MQIYKQHVRRRSRKVDIVHRRWHPVVEISALELVDIFDMHEPSTVSRKLFSCFIGLTADDGVLLANGLTDLGVVRAAVVGVATSMSREGVKVDGDDVALSCVTWEGLGSR